MNYAVLDEDKVINFFEEIIIMLTSFQNGKYYHVFLAFFFRHDASLKSLKLKLGKQMLSNKLKISQD